MKACYNGQTDAAELLLAKGADVEAKDKVSQGDSDLLRIVEGRCSDPVWNCQELPVEAVRTRGLLFVGLRTQGNLYPHVQCRTLGLR
jgi:hypothetical protein